jgi:hypothetical protein
MKGIFLFFIATGIALTAHAQEFGVKGGINLANTRTTDLDVDRSNNMVIDFHLGMFAEFEVNEIVSLQPELLYSREGSATDDIFNERIRFQMNFIQVPLLVKFTVAEQLNLHLGPQTGFLVARKLRSDAASVEIQENVYKSVVFSAVGGAGFQLNDHMEVGGRYNLGLTNWEKDRSEDTRGPGTTGSVIQFYLSYVFQ